MSQRLPSVPKQSQTADKPSANTNGPVTDTPTGASGKKPVGPGATAPGSSASPTPIRKLDGTQVKKTKAAANPPNPTVPQDTPETKKPDSTEKPPR
jgi:hypothetical protein